MDEMEVSNLMLLNLFRRSAHLQMRRHSRFQGQGRILILLREHGGRITQRELSQITLRRAATLCEQLEAMERAGLIEREKSAEDRRNVDIRLTENGGTAAVEAEAERAEIADRLFSMLEAGERRQLYDLLHKLSDAWQRDCPEGGETV